MDTLTEYFNGTKPIAIAVVVVLTAALLNRAWRAPYDPREPPVIRPWIPYVGHILGMLVYGSKYFTKLCEKYDYPIFTLPMLSGRLYIASSPALVSQVQRQSKTLSFEPLIADITDRLCSIDPPIKSALLDGFNSDNQKEHEGNLLTKMHHLHISVLGPGQWLEELSSAQLNHSAKLLGDVPDGTKLDLFAWIRHLMSISNMQSVYGPKNIFALRPELCDDFWVFEQNLVELIARVFPSLIARKGYMARERVTAALVEWVRKGYYQEASHLIQERIRLNSTKFNMEQVARVELSVMFAILTNAVPTTCWMIAYLFTHLTLLSKVRQELEQSDLVRSNGMSRTISISKLKTCCPLLVSMFREILRFYAANTSARQVLEDTIIADKYLLKKGNMVQIAGDAIHKDARVWGSDVGQFNPYRFVNSSSGTFTEELPGEKAKTVHPVAFRGFGGGTSLCPGRHFAQSEIVGLAAVIVLGYDLMPVDSDELVLPSKKEPLLPLGVLKPDGDMKVRLQRRQGLEGVQWAFEN